MKKTTILIMVILMAFTFAACGQNSGETITPTETPAPTAKPTPTPTPEPTPTPIPELVDSLEDIIKKIHEVMDPESTAHMVMQEVTSDNVAYFLGTDQVEFTEALASEPMIGVMPHSIVILRVAEGTDVTAVVELIKANADGRKWICVGVEDEDVLVNSIGHTIALIIDENSDQLMDAFLNQIS